VALPTKRLGSSAPPAGEGRLISDEVVIEVAPTMSPQAIAALEQRHGLIHLEQLSSQLTGTILLRARIQDGRSVTTVVLAGEADPEMMSIQPNYISTLQQTNTRRDSKGEAPQYAVAKLRLTQAHQLAKGNNVLVAMIDSGVDPSHPELEGAIAERFDTLDGSGAPHIHGTAVASAIVARARLLGAAPEARILAVRAFDSAGAVGAGSTFDILEGLDWGAVKGASVINLSFAGPSDPAIRRSLDGAYKNGIVLIAAAGNQGRNARPLYPAADPSVIAVTATDAQDKVFAASNRGRHIAIGAPGVDILLAAPDGRYQLMSGTSFAAAEVSGIAALMIERNPTVSPAAVRTILLSTGRLLGSDGVRLVDAYRALSADRVLPAAAR
jgi:subtilisin family serine protease